MALFLGTLENKIDSKGRVSVPSDFRNAIKSDDFYGIILFHSFTNKCIEGITMSRMEEIANAADNIDLFSEENQNINSLIFSDARQLSFDINGRVFVPNDLVEFAGISDKALFVGRGKTFQIWNPEEFIKAQEGTRKSALARRPSLKLGGV